MRHQNKEIDTSALSEAVNRKMRRLDLTLGDVAEQTGISTSTLSRISRNIGFPDGDTLAAICEWLEIPVERFFSKRSAGAAVYYPNAPLPEIVESICLADKNLTPDDARRLSTIFRTSYEQFTEQGV